MGKIGGIVAALMLAGPAWAGDGSWTQIDAWSGGVQWVTNVERGAWLYGTAAGHDDGESWGRVALLRGWAVGEGAAPWMLRAGVAGRVEQVAPWETGDHRLARCLPSDPGTCGAFAAGVRLSASRWAEHGRWGTFLMAEWTSIDNETLAVAGLTDLPSGIGGQLSLWHEDGGELTPTLMLSAPLTKRLSLRVGHKFVEDETFVGLSLSTY